MAEAGDRRRNNGCCLGTVGSTIVVETLVELAKSSSISIFKPGINRPDTQWQLLDILKIAGVVAY